MEQLSDLRRSLNERFTSPLILSFLISWLFVNWKISVALLWHSARPIGVQEELISYVAAILNPWDAFLWPLTFALAYTLFYPVIKNMISAYNTFNTRWGETWNLSISKNSELNKLIAEHARLTKMRDNISNIEVIAGHWTRTVYLPTGNISMNIEITNTNVFVREGVAMDQRYQLASFTFNSENQVVRFMLQNLKDSTISFHSFEDLELRNNEMVGWEYKTGSRAEVRYTKYR